MKLFRSAVRSIPQAVLSVGILLSLTAVPVPATGQQTPASTDGSPDPADRQKVLVLDFQTLDKSVNPDEAGEIARVATDAARMFRERLQDDGRFTLVTMEQFEDARSRLRSRGTECDSGACAREAARSTGIEHVFRGRVVKVSNLIWYLVVEHEDVASGKVVGQEAIELKGQRDVILPRAVAALHRWLLPAG
jgi:hypothetical protein